jgi:hypothetical protein
VKLKFNKTILYSPERDELVVYFGKIQFWGHAADNGIFGGVLLIDLDEWITVGDL